MRNATKHDDYLILKKINFPDSKEGDSGPKFEIQLFPHEDYIGSHEVEIKVSLLKYPNVKAIKLKFTVHIL